MAKAGDSGLDRPACHPVGGGIGCSTLGRRCSPTSAVRIFGKPADAEHHYGHGKVESATALAETASLFLLTGAVIFEAVRRLIGVDPHAVEATAAAFAVIRGLIVVYFSCRHAQARRQGDVERGVTSRCAWISLRHVAGCGADLGFGGVAR